VNQVTPNEAAGEERILLNYTTCVIPTSNVKYLAHFMTFDPMQIYRRDAPGQAVRKVIRSLNRVYSIIT
jgi:hypothetical protein